MKFDELLLSHLGEFGRYQKIQYALFCLPTIFVAMQSLSWTFTASNLPHRCRVSASEPLNANYWSGNELLRRKDCKNPAKYGCEYEPCLLAGEKCPHGYIYDRTNITYSAVDRWDIVCGRAFLKAVIQALYYVGQMAGSLAFGILGDRIGRKRVFFLALLLLMVAGSAMTIAPHWTLFGFFRCLVGFAHPGIITISVVIATELVGPSKRKLASVLSSMFFAIGQAILGTVAYFLRDYQYLQMTISLPAFFLVLYWWLVPESARWLVTQKRYEDADAVLKKVARVNKSTLPEKWWEQIEDFNGKPEDAGEREKEYGLRDLFRTPVLRKRSLVSFFLYFVVAMLYYGVAMKTDFLGGNLYETFIAGSLIEIPALIFLTSIADKVGRRPIFAISYFVAGLSILSSLLVGDKVHRLVSMLQFLITKAAAVIAYTLVYMVVPELFPTVIRNTALGCASVFARIGTIAASFVSMWVVDVVGTWIMVIPFGSLSLLAGVVVLLFIPETKGQPLPENIEEIESSAKKQPNSAVSSEIKPLTK